MICGNCGSNLTAEEKLKKLKDGSIKKYIYYGCSRNKDKKCNNLYIREEDFIKQIVELLNDIKIPEEDIKNKLQTEIDRFNSLQQQVFKINNIKLKANKTKQIDLVDYAKFVLNNGSIEEKREFMSIFKDKFIMKDKKIGLL